MIIDYAVTYSRGATSARLISSGVSAAPIRLSCRDRGITSESFCLARLFTRSRPNNHEPDIGTLFFFIMITRAARS